MMKGVGFLRDLADALLALDISFESHEDRRMDLIILLYNTIEAKSPGFLEAYDQVAGAIKPQPKISIKTVTDNEPDFNETGSLTDYILDLVAYHRRHANRVFANDLQALAARFALSWIALRVYEIGKKLKASGVRQSANVEIESEVIKVLERLLPDWHEEDDGTKHNGDVMCEITYGDVRSIKHLLAKLRPK